MATTLDGFKILRAYICSYSRKGSNSRGREFGTKMVIQIDRNYKNGRINLLSIIGGRKDIKRNILNAIVEIKDLFLGVKEEYFEN